MLSLALTLLCLSVPVDPVARMKAVYREAPSYSAYVAAEGIVKGRQAWSIELGLRFMRPNHFNYSGSVNPETKPFPVSLTATPDTVQITAGNSTKNFSTIKEAQDQMPLAALILTGLLGLTDKPFSPACLSPNMPSLRFKYLKDEQGCHVAQCRYEPGVGWQATDTATLWIDKQSFHLKKLVMDFIGKDKPEDRFVLTIRE